MYYVIFFQIRPDHAKFRNGPPPNLVQQDVMFMKAHVTGESAGIAGEDTGDGKDAPILLDDEHDASASRITGKRKYGSGEKEKESPFFTAYNNALSTLVSKHTEGSSCSKDESVPTMKEFLAMVRELGVLEGTDIMFTASKLAMNRDHREVFAAFATTDGRLDWLKRTHNEMNK